MAEQDFFADDDDARKAYETKPFNMDAARGKATKWLDKIRDQIGSGATRGRRNWSTENNSFQITLPFAHNGVSKVHRSADKVTGYLEGLKAAITDGKFDDSIRTHFESDATTTETIRAPRAKREPGSSGATGWTQARRDRFTATLAAKKKAAKG